MLRPSEFRELVSGRRPGAKAQLARGLLRIVEVPYTIAVAWRNRRYDRGHAEVHRMEVPVISVGNLSLGGTGKTPMVKWLAQRFLDSGLRVAIVSRGYGAPNGQHNDEALELTAALPNVPHIQNRDRVAAARRAIQEFDPQWLILDDGFQHRRLARDINIVLLDALEPFGFEHVFPRGTLREPLTGLERADVVCLSRADAIAESQRTAIRDRVAQISPQAAWCELAHAANKLINSQGETQPLEFLAGRRVAAFCGIGNPAGFRHTLLSTSCELVAWREFPDHHSYTPADLSAVRDAALDTNSTAIICTQKDLVKICQHQLGHIPLWAVNIEMRFLAGQETLERILDRAIRPECE